MTTADAEKVPLWLKWHLFREAVQSKATAGSAGALSVLFWLLEDYDRDGTRVCAPSLDRLAGLAQTSRRTVVTAIDKLVEAGFVQRLEKGGGRYRSTHYAFPWIEARMAERVEPSQPRGAAAQASPRPRKTGKPTSQKTARPDAGGPETVSTASQNGASFDRNCEDNCEAASSHTVKLASHDSRDSQNHENPSSPSQHPGPQRHFLLPISGKEGRTDLDGMVSRRFRISREDAAELVRSWLKQTNPETLREVVADAAAQGVSREGLPGFVQAQLRPHQDPPAKGSGARSAPHPSADGEADDDPAWQRVRERLRKEVGDAPFKAWIRGVGFQGCQGDTAVLVAPTQQVAGWVRSHYADRLRAAWQAEAADVRAVRIEVAVQAATG